MRFPVLASYRLSNISFDHEIWEDVASNASAYLQTGSYDEATVGRIQYNAESSRFE